MEEASQENTATAESGSDSTEATQENALTLSEALEALNRVSINESNSKKISDTIDSIRIRINDVLATCNDSRNITNTSFVTDPSTGRKTLPELSSVPQNRKKKLFTYLIEGVNSNRNISNETKNNIATIIGSAVGKISSIEPDERNDSESLDQGRNVVEPPTERSGQQSSQENSNDSNWLTNSWKWICSMLEYVDIFSDKYLFKP